MENIRVSEAARELGRLGGQAKARKMTSEERIASARHAAMSRWRNHVPVVHEKKIRASKHDANGKYLYEGRLISRQRVHQIKYPERHAAREAAKSLPRQPCEVCGEPRAQSHHDDYGKPLEVRWLCQKHHREAHAKR